MRLFVSYPWLDRLRAESLAVLLRHAGIESQVCRYEAGMLPDLPPPSFNAPSGSILR